MTGSVIILRNTAHLSPFLYHSIIPNTGHLCFSNTSQTEAAQSWAQSTMEPCKMICCEQYSQFRRNFVCHLKKGNLIDVDNYLVEYSTPWAVVFLLAIFHLPTYSVRNSENWIINPFQLTSNMCPLKSLRWILKTFKYKSYSPINVLKVFKSVYFLKFFLHNTQL